MKKWASPSVTNTLLLIIAFFLLLLVINTSSHDKKRNPHHDGIEGMGAPPPMDQTGVNPHAQMDDSAPNEAAPPASQENFNFQNMLYAALRCPSDGTIPLGDAACKGAEATKRRSVVDSLATQNLPPRMMFDKVIELYGEKALTDEALEIRKNNRR